jgi:hypothetical protein
MIDNDINLACGNFILLLFKLCRVGRDQTRALMFTDWPVVSAIYSKKAKISVRI